MFEGMFKQQIENVNLYLSNPDFIDSTMKQGGNSVSLVPKLVILSLTIRTALLHTEGHL